MQPAIHPPAPSFRCLYARDPAPPIPRATREAAPVGRCCADFDPPPDPAALVLVRCLLRTAPHLARGLVKAVR